MTDERIMAITSINVGKPLSHGQIVDIVKKQGIDDVIQVSNTNEFEYEVTYWQYPE